MNIYKINLIAFITTSINILNFITRVNKNREVLLVVWKASFGIPLNKCEYLP